MTNQELLSTIQALPAEQQFELANSILDNLFQSGNQTLSNSDREVLDCRLFNFLANTAASEPWEKVEREIFGE
jgi:hypothetical protein